MNTFLTSNKMRYRLARTVLQAVIGFVVANLTALVAMTQLDGNLQAMIVAITMIILSPVMKALGMEDEKARDENRGDADAD